MKLKSIEMQGFKSFPDKTRITFDDGVTAIIGPNGSGKSNISDAVRWVLGEMSMKSLRGSKMEDVIFNGTPTRPAANFSAVSLTLDTTAEYDRHAQTFMSLSEEEKNADDKKDEYKLHDGTEVTITRKYYRSGESEYYINKKQVRLKDIYELFYDTGIGREGYSVISQGKISEVLSQKGHERRDIFEEAAGISKFRYKKAEAERKLAETENNLIRINDILSEVSSRIGPLEKEAENAKKYLVLSEEKKGLEITLWLDKIDKLRGDLERNATETAGARLALDNSENDVRTLDYKLDNALREGYDIGRELSETERLISESEKNIASIESEKALRLNDAEHYRRMARQYGEDISVNKRELSLAADMLSAAIEVGKELESEHAKVKEEFALAEEAYAKYRDTAVLCAEKEQNALSEQTKAYETVSRLRESYAAIKAKSEESVRARDEAEAQLSASAARMAELKSVLERAASALNSAEVQVNETAEKYAEATKKCDENRTLRNQLNEKLSAVNLEISALEHRRENLRRMEALFEGYSDGVKNVMNASELKGIVGTVSSVVSTDEKYVLALETALGASAQFIITEKEEDAKNAVKYLKKTSGGRATFLPIDTVTGNRVNEEPFKNVKGYIGIASDMVKSDKRFRTVIDDLLGRTVLTENMDSATSAASACGYKVKVVTLDGQV
ncbi:MAG: AAA family ATPase, partial [Clostridia bacterium]|nr:AAA family ATPase [Clostridia bacterium]